MRTKTITLLLASAGLAIAIPACKGAVENKTEEAAVSASGLNLAAMDKNVKPGDDFYAYANGNSYSHPHANAYPNGNPDSHRHTNAYSNSNPDSHSHGDANSNTYSHRDAYAHGHSNPNSNPDTTRAGIA